MGALNFPSIDSAIADFEHSNPAYNNPGSIMYGPFAIQQGATGKAGNGLATFRDPQTGTAATDALVTNYASQGFSLSGMLNKWAPGGAPGNTQQSTDNYVASVAKQTGLDPNAPIMGDPFGAFDNWINTHIMGAKTSTNVEDKSLLGSFPFGRIATIVIGFIFIAGGIYLFKPVQNIVTTGKALAL